MPLIYGECLFVSMIDSILRLIDDRWVGGLEAAVVKNGEGVTVLPHRALTMITGIRSGGTKTRDRNHPSKGLSKKEMYEVMKKAETTPILFQSIKDAKKMAHNHAWAVLRTDTNEEGKEGYVISTYYLPS